MMGTTLLTISAGDTLLRKDIMGIHCSIYILNIGYSFFIYYVTVTL